jgi:hypothetical protein
VQTGSSIAFELALLEGAASFECLEEFLDHPTRTILIDDGQQLFDSVDGLTAMHLRLQFG